MEQVLIISLFSGLATGLGGLIVLWFGNPSEKLLGFYLGISAGMMGMVVLVDLLPASFQYGSVPGSHTGSQKCSDSSWMKNGAKELSGVG